MVSVCRGVDRRHHVSSHTALVHQACGVVVSPYSEKRQWYGCKPESADALAWVVSVNQIKWQINQTGDSSILLESDQQSVNHHSQTEGRSRSP